MAKQTQTFDKGLDKDSELRTVAQGAYREARNIRNGTSKSGDVNAIEPIMSNVLKTSGYSFPAGTNKCIGTCPDYKNQSIIYCIWNSNNNHRIIRFNPQTDVVTDILPTAWTVSILNWTQSTRLWNMRIVESGTQQIMFFTDGVNAPRRINLGISALRAGTYTLTIDDINVARKPPAFPAFAPSSAFAIDTVNKSNFILGKFFQFRYRWVYEDLEISTFGAWSDLTIPPNFDDNYNKILVTVNSGPKGVSKIEVSRREGNGTSDTGSTNPFEYIFATIDKGSITDNQNFQVSFFNTEVLRTVPLSQSSKLFDQVPETAGAQEVIESNQVIYGDILEGKDNVEMNVDFTLEWENLYYEIAHNVLSFVLATPASFDYQVGDYLQFDVLPFGPVSGWRGSVVITSGALSNYPDSLGEFIRDTLNAEGFTASYNPATDTVTNNNVIASLIVMRGALVDTFVPTFKTGAYHGFGIVYYDEYLRQCGVQKIANEYVQLITEITPYSANTPTRPYFDWAIKNRPPLFAKYWRWVYNGGDIQKFVWTTSETTTIPENKRMTFKISPIFYYPTEQFDTIPYLEIEKGDRIRFIYGLSQENSASPFWIPYLNQTDIRFVELTVYDFDTATTTITCDATDQVISNSIGLIEIYKKTNSELYFEMPEMYQIGNAGTATRYHLGETQNQDPNDPIGIPATGSLYKGAIYTRVREYGPDISTEPTEPYIIEAPNITDNYVSDFWDKGRVQIETPDQRAQRIQWLIRWGGKLLQDTQVNNMSSFDAGNYKVLSAKWGAVTGLREIGYTLKILQEINYSTAFVGRREIQNADGSTQLVVTDNLIGTINPSEKLYGTKHKGSIVVEGRRLYFLDTTKGVYIRESGNDPFEISKYGMVSYWRDASESINRLGLEIISGYDKQMECLFVTRKLGSINLTQAFYDEEGKQPKWIAENYSFNKLVSGVQVPIEMYGSVGNIFTSALNGNIYEHNAGTDFLNLFGEAKTLYVQSVFNPEPQRVKIFVAHGCDVNIPWDNSYFRIPANSRYPNGMLSRLVEGNYVNKEGMFYADLKNDVYTKGLVIIDSPQFFQQLVSGRPMREQVCLVELNYTGSSIFVLLSHDLTYLISEWS